MPIVSKQTPNNQKTPNQKGQTLTNRSASTSRSKSVIDRIAPIGFGADEGIKILLYGRSATGKTTLWATFPKPILAIICSGGNKPGELRSIDTPEYRKSIRQVAMHRSEEMKDLVRYLHEGEGADYATVVLDHCSGFQDMILKEILGLEEIPTSKRWGMATKGQYGECAVQVQGYLQKLLNLVANVVLVAQERDFKSEEESDVIAPSIGAGLQPGIVRWLNPAVDYIGQTMIRQKEKIIKRTVGEGKNKVVTESREKVKGEVEYCLRTGPDPIYHTKFRVPKGNRPPEFIVDPDYDKIQAVINGLKEGHVSQEP